MAEHLRLRDRLGTRLGAAFAVTAVGAVVAALALVGVTTDARVDQLTSEQRDEVMQDVTAALATAHARAGGWADADLLPAHTLAASAGAVLTVTTGTGDVLRVPPDVDDLQRRLQRGHDAPSSDAGNDAPPAPRTDERHGPRGQESSAPADRVRGAGVGDVEAATDDAVEVEEERRSDVVVDGRRVGTATLRFVRQDRVDPVAMFRDALTRNLAVAGGVAVLLALAATAWVTPRLTRPLRRLTAAVDRVAHGDRSDRQDLGGAVGELGVLARSVDRMADDLAREDRLRRALVADVAHEVRTPLTVLLGEVEALEDGVVLPDADHLASLHEEVLRLARLIEDLDAIAAAEAAGLGLRREVVDLAGVASAALSGLADQLAQTSVAVDTAWAPVAVRGDPGRLEQLVRNLVTNAAKFSPAGGRVTLRVAADGSEAVLEVTDDGPGIADDELPHVFERFWRGERARGTPGSGVGLAVVAELAAAHGGGVEAGNAPGRGARFTVRLPRAPSPAGGTDEVPARDRVPTA